MSDENESQIFWMDSETPEMQNAVKSAQATFKFLWRELSWEYRRIIPALNLSCVKAPFFDPVGEDDESPNVEQMWVSDLNFDGETIYGTLINEPHHLTSVKQGDEIELSLKGISDWMYAINDIVYGAYTVNLIRAQMDEEERLAHDQAWDLDFGDPNSIRLVPEDWGTDNPDESEHPMSENMGDSLDEFLKEDPSALTATDENGLTMLHSLALAGSSAGVQAILSNGGDKSVKTNAGYTAFELAQKMGWPNVVKLLQA